MKTTLLHNAFSSLLAYSNMLGGWLRGTTTSLQKLIDSSLKTGSRAGQGWNLELEDSSKKGSIWFNDHKLANFEQKAGRYYLTNCDKVPSWVHFNTVAEAVTLLKTMVHNQASARYAEDFQCLFDDDLATDSVERPKTRLRAKRS